MFKNRADAGRQLARALSRENIDGGVVLAIPRGGVVVAAEVARANNLRLDLIIPRKIGAPHNPEVAIGAVTQDGTVIYNGYVMSVLGLKENDLQKEILAVINEINRRMERYRGSPDYPDYSGQTIIIVDDGVATGYTVLAAIRSARKLFKPRELILAIPVSPPDTLEQLRREADKVICLSAPHDFMAVGQFYRDFDQTGDDEVLDIMKEFTNP